MISLTSMFWLSILRVWSVRNCSTKPLPSTRLWKEQEAPSFSGRSHGRSKPEKATSDISRHPLESNTELTTSYNILLQLTLLGQDNLYSLTKDDRWKIPLSLISSLLFLDDWYWCSCEMEIFYFFFPRHVFTLVLLLKGVIVVQWKKTPNKYKIGSNALISAGKTKITTIFSGCSGYSHEQPGICCITPWHDSFVSFTWN